MKKGIHPDYYEDAVIKCACGNTVTTGSARKEMRIEVCSSCHPFFTGELKRTAVDTGGRVEKFKRKYDWKEK